MKTRPLILLSGATCLLMAAVAALALARLPANTQLPVHWNAAGAADGFARAGIALFMPVVVTVALAGLFAVLPAIEPLQDRMRDSAPLLANAWVGLLLMMVLIEAAIAAPAFHVILPAMLPLAGVGLLFLVIGNALPKSRPGYFVGIRTPWTLTDPDNWIATHRLGSRTMMLGGVILLVAALSPIPAADRMRLLWLAVAVAVVPPIVFSYFYWRRAKSSPAREGGSPQG